jgi:hypothetical protein
VLHDHAVYDEYSFVGRMYVYFCFFVEDGTVVIDIKQPLPETVGSIDEKVSLKVSYTLLFFMSEILIFVVVLSCIYGLVFMS